MSTPTILVAEDEFDIRELLVFALEFNGFTVISVSNGKDAVEKAIETLPDLILLDVRMPRVTGYDACKTLKENETTKHIPIVFLSAKGQESEIKFGTALGAEAYILKPFSPDELADQVKRLLKKHNKL